MPDGWPVFQGITSFAFPEIQRTQAIPNPNKIKSLSSLQLMGKDYLERQMVGHAFYFDATELHFVLQADGKLLRDTSIWTTFPNSQRFFYNPFRPEAWQIEGEGPSVYTPLGLVYRFRDDFSDFSKELFLRQVRFDENDVTWLSMRFGVFRIQLKPNLFQRILYNQFSELESPAKHICQGVIPGSEGRLLLSTQQGFFEKKEDAREPPSRLKEIADGSQVALAKGYRDDIWGRYGRALYRIKTDGSNYAIERQHFGNQKGFSKVFDAIFQRRPFVVRHGKGVALF